MPPTDLSLLVALKRLLDDALELSQTERGPWLTALRSRHPAHAAELERLLEAEASIEQHRFLADGPGSDDGQPVGGLVGQRLGAWTLERPLGQGGMGTVWLARRSDGRFEGTAAVKLLNLALLDAVGSARFRREGSLLARLDHPNIARLLDAGVTEYGQPYLVIEHVEGERIDRWCDANRLTPEQRLRLFLDVLGAVGHAHANLIVHRDLKPSNILVTASGAVKLLDFGIAKLLDDETGAEATTLTAVGGQALTPEFASPEQVAGGSITTATDVYALGVLLYVLLAGRHPTGEASRTTAEHLKAVLEIEPLRLSSTVCAAEVRSTSEERLRRLYRGDLENIAAKALKKRPDERYATVGAFADDIRRYLHHEPVRARPDSFGYRTGKFIRRNRAAVVGAAITCAVLLAATAVSLLQTREATRQRDAAIAESRRRLAMADVQGVLAADTRGPGGRALSMLERIELAEQLLTRKYQREPAVVVEVMADLSNRLFEQGDLRAHRAVLARAGNLARRAGLTSELALVQCFLARALSYDRRFDSAQAALTEAWGALARSPAPAQGTEVHCLVAEGDYLVATSRADSGVTRLRRAVALAGPDSPNSLVAFHVLATALRATGHTREAAEYHRKVLGEVGPETDASPNALAFLAGALAELGELRTIDSIIGGFVRRQERLQGTGVVEGARAVIYGVNKLRRGEVDSAAVWLGVAERDTSERNRHATTAWLPPARAQLLIEQGRFTEARAVVDNLPDDTPTRRITRALLRARLRRAAGDVSGARTALDSALAAEMRDGRPPHYLVYALLIAAEWGLRDGLPQVADSLAGLAVTAATVDSLASARSAHVGRAELIRARVAVATRNPSEAAAALSRAMPPLRAGYGAAHPLVAEAEALARSRGGF
jgi:serine/threonine-protein kinase